MIMAKEKEVKKDIKDEVKLKKKKRKKKVLLILVLIIIVVGGILVYNFKFKNKNGSSKNVVTVKVVDSLDDYGYSISDKDSKYYKSEFEILKELAKNDDATEEEIVKQVAKLYVIDLLSLQEKINKYEVTCSQYFYSDKRSMNTQKIIDNFYNLIQDNAYNDRKQELPSVKNVEITNYDTDKYKMNDTTVNSYDVTLKVEYQKDLGYDKNVAVTLVKDGNNYSIVTYNPTKS